MKFSLSVVLCSLLFIGCKEKSQTTNTMEDTMEVVAPSFQNKGEELVYNMIQKVGDYNTLASKKDVVYTYTYQTPDGGEDITTEKYLFDGELSYGAYHKHQRTLPELEGEFEQGYDGSEYWLRHKGQLVSDTTALKRVAFNRPTNFYWFTMFQKLLDPGVNYEFMGEKTVSGTAYNVVNITFNSEGGKPTDIYRLYINKETAIVDQFLFTVADFNVMKNPFLMQLEYEEVDGMLMPTKRKYKKSTWDAAVSEDPWIQVSWTDIKFNTGLTKDDFKK